MGRKSRKNVQEKEHDVSNYYQLNTKAVDDLVTASPENSPNVSPEELRKYRSGPQIHLKDWIKALLIKWWFNGAACFFFLWGLGTVVPNWENQLLILGLAIGLFTDLLVNNIFRYYSKTPGENDRWMMFGKKGFISLPLNIIYGFLLLFCVVTTYQVINGTIVTFNGQSESVPLGVGPIMFGLFTSGYDFLFIGMKHLIKRIIEDAKRRNQSSAR